MTKNVDPFSLAVLRVLYATGRYRARRLCVKNVTGLLPKCLDVIFTHNNINVIRSLFPKNLLKEVTLTKRFVKQIIVALKFFHTRFAVFFPCHSLLKA